MVIFRQFFVYLPQGNCSGMTLVTYHKHPLSFTTPWPGWWSMWPAHRTGGDVPWMSHWNQPTFDAEQSMFGNTIVPWFSNSTSIFPYFSHGFPIRSPKDAIDLCQVAVGGYAHLWNQRSQWPRQVPQICFWGFLMGFHQGFHGDFMGFSMGFSMGCMGWLMLFFF